MPLTTWRLRCHAACLGRCSGSPAVFCPEESAAATTVDVAYYSVGDTPATAHSQAPCPAGSYCLLGAAFPCPAGSYCRPMTASDEWLLCGNSSVFCQSGASTPVHVSHGFYTTGGLSFVGVRVPSSDTSVAAPCDGLLVHVRTSAGGTESTRTGQALCEAGFACSAGVKTECADGHVSARGADACTACLAGFREVLHQECTPCTGNTGELAGGGGTRDPSSAHGFALASRRQPSVGCITHSRESRVEHVLHMPSWQRRCRQPGPLRAVPPRPVPVWRQMRAVHRWHGG